MRSALLTLIFAIAVGALGCTNAPAPTQTSSNNAAASTNANERPQTMIAHSTENQPPPGSANAPTTRTKWTQGGDAIDTGEFDSAIAKVTKSSDKRAIGEAYFNRAVALTHARQYASALGDYRKAIKYDPDNAEAKQWIDQILGIYDSMNKEAPKEGEEPPPLPFKKS